MKTYNNAPQPTAKAAVEFGVSTQGKLVDASNFRDKMISRITIGYDCDELSNFAEINLRSNDGVISSFKVNGLTEYLLYDDFLASYISECKLIIQSDTVYLSLDPYGEQSIIDKDNDNQWFKGRSLTKV